MTLIVENGAGLPNANCYISLADFKAYFSIRGTDISAYSDSDIEAAIVVAALDWIDGQHTFTDIKLAESQSMEFPRYDTEIGLPTKIVHANAKAGLLQLHGSLLVDTSALDLDGEVESSSKSVGTLSKSVSYRSGTSQRYSRVIPRDLTMLLQPYLAYSSTKTRVM